MPSQAPSARPTPEEGLTTPERVARVIADPNPIRRNLAITQSYHELGAALHRRLGGPDLNWCLVAVWASRQAGRFIRREQVPAPLAAFLHLDGRRRPPSWTRAGLLKSPRFLAYARATVDDVAAGVARGNHLVYTKLAPLFARFLRLLDRHPRPDPATFGRFLAEIGADPTTGDALLGAFRHYHTALFEPPGKGRAERIFLANLLVGWHEQVRLQEAIESALKAPIRRALDDPERRWSTLPLPAGVRRLGAAAFRLVWAPAIRSFEDEWLTVATRCMITLALPEGPLRLGEDVPPLPHGAMYPADLVEVTSAELRALLARLDRTPNTLAGSAARDWTTLGDRMNYIADLFRSRQQSPALLDPPFTAAQAAAIRRGELPHGRV